MKNTNKSKKIILVEDSFDIREMYRIKLEMENYEVVIAEDGSVVLNLIKKEKPDLILLDILLPKKDGFEVLEEIKKNQDNDIKSIPVIMLTNLSNKEDIEEAKKLGATDYFVKAKSTPEEIVEKINEVLK